MEIVTPPLAVGELELKVPDHSFNPGPLEKRPPPNSHFLDGVMVCQCDPSVGDLLLAVDPCRRHVGWFCIEGGVSWNPLKVE